jgi:hypothetical protein
MSTIIGDKFRKSIANQFQAVTGYIVVDKFVNPIAASATRILSATSLASGGTVTTFLAQPDVARNLQIVASGATTAVVTVNGTDVRGNVISEALTLNGATPVLGAKAFKTVTSVVLPTVAATTINLGVGVLLGLSRILANGDVGMYIQGSAAGVFEATRAGLTTSATVPSLNTVSFNTAPNGAKTFNAVYASNELWGGLN